MKTTTATKTRKPTQLTVVKATLQARREVNKLMVGTYATVESKLSHDLATDTATVITTVTFPKDHPMRRRIAAALADLPGAQHPTLADSSIVLVRTR